MAIFSFSVVHICEEVVQSVFEWVDGGRLHHIERKLLPVVENSLCEEVSSNAKATCHGCLYWCPLNPWSLETTVKNLDETMSFLPDTILYTSIKSPLLVLFARVVSCCCCCYYYSIFSVGQHNNYSSDPEPILLPFAGPSRELLHPSPILHSTLEHSILEMRSNVEPG